MQIRPLSPETLPQVAQEAADVLRAGGVVLFPTDTLYCLGADALSDAGVDAVYDIKGRESQKPMHALVSDIAMASVYCEVSPKARTLVERFGGRVSIVAPQKNHEKTGILRGLDTFGFRIPYHELSQAIIRAFGGPITATSANVAGGEPGKTLGEVLGQLGPALMSIDLAIDGGPVANSLPSTVLDMTRSDLVVLREGAVSQAELEGILKGK
jgi:L-threonylcarbamoyladenylate synthase